MTTKNPAAIAATIPLQAQSLPEFTQALIAVCERLQEKITLHINLITDCTVICGDNYGVGNVGRISGGANVFGDNNSEIANRYGHE